MGKGQTGSWHCAHTELLDGKSTLAAAPKHTVNVFGKVKNSISDRKTNKLVLQCCVEQLALTETRCVWASARPLAKH